MTKQRAGLWIRLVGLQFGCLETGQIGKGYDCKYLPRRPHPSREQLQTNDCTRNRSKHAIQKRHSLPKAPFWDPEFGEGVHSARGVAAIVVFCLKSSYDSPCDAILGGHFGPEKKYLAPRAPNAPIRRRHPPGPSPSWRPPSWDFQ